MQCEVESWVTDLIYGWTILEPKASEGEGLPKTGGNAAVQHTPKEELLGNLRAPNCVQRPLSLSW